MIDKTVASIGEALEGIRDGSTLMVGGHGMAGSPQCLLRGVLETGVKDLCVIANNGGRDSDGLATLIQIGRVRKVICSYPKTGADAFREAYSRGCLELELVPQGTLSERIRAGGAGLGPFFCPVGAESALASGKELRIIDGQSYCLESPLAADVALIHARLGDRWGNVAYRKVARNYNPTMAMAARLTVAEVEETVPLGGIDPDGAITPGIYVDRILGLDQITRSSDKGGT